MALPLLLLLMAAVLVAYWVLLGRLVSAVRSQKPELFAAVGSPPASDYLLVGFFVGDGFVTKLEARSQELADLPRIRSLMRYVRSVWGVQLVLLGVAFFLVVR